MTGVQTCALPIWLKYLIEDYTLEVGIARAISNEMDETSDKAEILLRTGVLIVVESKD